MPPAARLTDLHVCPMITPGVPPIPHVGGPIIGPGAPTVLTGMMPQARIGDQCVCVGPPDVIMMGCPTVIVASMPAARIGDSTAHGGSIVLGFPTVLIGDGGGGGGGAEGGGGAGAVGFGMGSGKTGTTGHWSIGTTSGAFLPNAQASTLKNAAQSGAPFCEQCAKP